MRVSSSKAPVHYQSRCLSRNPRRSTASPCADIPHDTLEERLISRRRLVVLNETACSQSFFTAFPKRQCVYLLRLCTESHVKTCGSDRLENSAGQRYDRSDIRNSQFSGKLLFHLPTRVVFHVKHSHLPLRNASSQHCATAMKTQA